MPSYYLLTSLLRGPPVTSVDVEFIWDLSTKCDLALEFLGYPDSGFSKLNSRSTQDSIANRFDRILKD